MRSKKGIIKVLSDKNRKKLKCAGCGRHEKEVSADTNLWFCTHCVIDNNNYNRFQNGLPLVKPIPNLKANDIVLDSKGQPYLLLKKSYVSGEDTYFFCEQLFGKHETVELGDFCFYKKTGKREVNKINKAVDNGGKFSEFVKESSNRQSCLHCKFMNKLSNECDKLRLSLLDTKINPATCEHYKET